MTAGEGGGLWLVVSTDSGCEGLTDLYYQVIEVVPAAMPAGRIVRPDKHPRAADVTR